MQRNLLSPYRPGLTQCPPRPDQFHVAVICALPLEADAVSALFDHHWDGNGFPYDKAPGDHNVYSVGAMGRHNVVLAWLPGMGIASSASFAVGCRSTFPNIKLALVVGICRVVPFKPDGGEIVLGDIIISDGLVQYDFGRQYPEGFARKDTILDSLGRPSPEIRALSARLKSIRPQEMFLSKVSEYLSTLESHPKLQVKYPGKEFDKLFKPIYRHINDERPCDECCCDDYLVPRVRLQQSAPQPAVHFGLIATGNGVMKFDCHRDSIAKDDGVIAFEVEGAGVWDSFPCVVIKGAYDYADSHKTKIWQRYAAASAAAAMKAFICQWDNVMTAMYPIMLDLNRKVSLCRSISDSGLLMNLLELQEYQRSVLHILYPFGSEFEVQKDRNHERIAGTCEWFIKHERFQHWQETKCSSLLWVSADPWCGKSVLARYLVDDFCSKKSGTTCFFFFKDALQGQSEVTDALRCLLYQIFHQQPTLLSNQIASQIKEAKKSLNFRDLWRIFVQVTMCEGAGNTICILDALDECEERGRIQLLKALNKLYNIESPKFSLKILVTSRPYALIHRELQILVDRHPNIHLSGEDQVEQISREIAITIRARLKDITRIHRLTKGEESTLIQELTKPQNRTYLWVHLMFEELKKATMLTKHDLITRIHSLPKTVEEAYSSILDRSNDIDRTRKILHIVVAAQRALSLQEMAVALDITLNHQPHQDLQLPQNLRSHQELQPLDTERIKRNIREACGLFVVIKDSKVYLLHQTAREFLVRPLSSAPVDDNQPWHYSLCPMDSNRILAEICIWYLLLVDFQKIYTAADLEQANDRYPLLSYASKRPQFDFFRLETLFSLQEENHIWFQIYWKEEKNLWIYPSGFDALIIASYFGLESVVEELLAAKGFKTRFKTRFETWHGEFSRDITFERPALSWAIDNGHESVVELLLHQIPMGLVKFRDWLPGLYTCVNAKDVDGNTPLLIAISHSYDEIARQLTKKGADIEARDKHQKTPLAIAASWRGSDGQWIDIVQLLLEKGAGIEARDKNQRTPLALASNWGYTDIIRLLLENGADIEARDEDQRTPLATATFWGHSDVVQLFLEKGADSKARNKYNETPLQIATGHRDITRLLLKNEVGTERPSR
ncbi:unnamed protein product [Clonostachys byssicola]|uniref:Nephrocystin 3-like N-terminal domain-containing protein n=1 Tax=Clonostachys byssicola TaxID=160290 RepID=A0A9N9Y4R7_9HYPO|nr:unnamed protein product [Clonostachys byssicola]